MTSANDAAGSYIIAVTTIAAGEGLAVAAAGLLFAPHGGSTEYGWCISARDCSDAQPSSMRLSLNRASVTGGSTTAADRVAKNKNGVS
jgi:hypothetical protein